jgi:uncharacterized membrane protein YhaH (DUF805 family)
MNWYLQALKKYADFSGRARRKEYWFFVLFNIIISIVLSICGSSAEFVGGRSVQLRFFRKKSLPFLTQRLTLACPSGVGMR